MGIREVHNHRSAQRYRDTTNVTVIDDSLNILQNFDIPYSKNNASESINLFDNGSIAYTLVEQNVAKIFLSNSNELTEFFTIPLNTKEFNKIEFRHFARNNNFIGVSENLSKKLNEIEFEIISKPVDGIGDSTKFSYLLHKTKLKALYRQSNNLKLPKKWHRFKNYKVIDVQFDLDDNMLISIIKYKSYFANTAGELNSAGDIILLSVNKTGNLNWSTIIPIKYKHSVFPFKSISYISDSTMTVTYAENISPLSLSCVYSTIDLSSGKVKSRINTGVKMVYYIANPYHLGVPFVFTKNGSIVVKGVKNRKWIVEKYNL